MNVRTVGLHCTVAFFFLVGGGLFCVVGDSKKLHISYSRFLMHLIT